MAKSDPISVRISEELEQQLRDYADQHGMPLTYFIETALIEYFGRREPTIPLKDNTGLDADGASSQILAGEDELKEILESK